MEVSFCDAPPTCRQISARRDYRNPEADARISAIRERQRTDLDRDDHECLDGLHNTYLTLLDQMKGKDSKAIKAAQPLFEKALESHQKTFEVLAITTFDVHEKMLEKEVELEKDRISHMRLQNASMNEKQFNLAKAMVSYQTKQEALSFFGAKTPADFSQDGAIFDWLKEQEATIKELFPSRTFRFNDQIRETLRKFREHYESSQKWYRNTLLEISKNVLNTGERDPALEEIADFHINAQTNLAMLRLSTAQKMLKLDFLNLDIQLKEYQETIDVIFAMRIKHLELLEKKVAFLTKESTNDLRLIIIHHEMKMEEEDQKISQLIRLNQLQRNRNSQWSSHEKQHEVLESQPLKNLCKAQLDKELYSQKHQFLEQLYEQEMSTIREEMGTIL